MGATDTSGYLYLYETNGARFFTIDLNPERTSYLQLVDPTAGYAAKTSSPWWTPMGTARTISDWAYNLTDGMLYGMTNGDAGNPYRVVRVNPNSGISTIVSTAPVTGDGVQTGGTSQAYGSCFFDSDGEFYVFANYNGHLYHINISTNTATRLTTVGTPTS